MPDIDLIMKEWKTINLKTYKVDKIKAKMEIIFNDCDYGANLGFRTWKEKGNDITDYQYFFDIIEEKYGGTIENMHKKPFGCTFKVYGLRMRIKVNSNEYSMKQII